MHAEFDFLGVWDGVTDGALLAPTYEGTLPPAFLSGSFSVASYSAVIAGVSLDLGNTLTLRQSVNKAAGYVSCVITGRDPNGTMDPEMTLVATHDWYGRWKAGTTGALNIGPVGATQYNKFTITAPKVLYQKVSDAEREGLAVADTAFQLAMNTGDDELVLEFS